MKGKCISPIQIHDLTVGVGRGLLAPKEHQYAVCGMKVGQAEATDAHSISVNLYSSLVKLILSLDPCDYP